MSTMTKPVSIREQLDAVTVDSMRRRRGVKWARYAAPILPAWVADMDFPVCQAVTDVLGGMVQRSDVGYHWVPAPMSLLETFAERMQGRFDWPVQPSRIVMTVTVVQAIDVCLSLFSEPGDGVIVQTPIYDPFLAAVDRSGRRLVENPLVRGTERFEIDFDALARSIDSSTRVLLLCHPHNPSGRVFDRQELEALAELALRHDLVVISDEIHAELTYGGRRFRPFATLSQEIAERTITLTSATKSFNLAGLPCAFAHFGSERLLQRVRELPPHLLGHPGAFGIEATQAAWTDGDAWLEEVLLYLDENRRHLRRFLGDRLPEIDMVLPEATYLAWLDCRALDLPVKPSRFFFKRASLAFKCGEDFGQPGRGFVRLNFATSRQILDQILERMVSAVADAGRS